MTDNDVTSFTKHAIVAAIENEMAVNIVVNKANNKAIDYESIGKDILDFIGYVLTIPSYRFFTKEALEQVHGYINESTDRLDSILNFLYRFSYELEVRDGVDVLGVFKKCSYVVCKTDNSMFEVRTSAQLNPDLLETDILEENIWYLNTAIIRFNTNKEVLEIITNKVGDEK